MLIPVEFAHGATREDYFGSQFTYVEHRCVAVVDVFQFPTVTSQVQNSSAFIHLRYALLVFARSCLSQVRMFSRQRRHVWCRADTLLLAFSSATIGLALVMLSFDQQFSVGLSVQCAQRHRPFCLLLLTVDASL